MSDPFAAILPLVARGEPQRLRFAMRLPQAEDGHVIELHPKTRDDLGPYLIARVRLPDGSEEEAVHFVAWWALLTVVPPKLRPLMVRDWQEDASKNLTATLQSMVSLSQAAKLVGLPKSRLASLAHKNRLRWLRFYGSETTVRVVGQDSLMLHVADLLQVPAERREEEPWLACDRCKQTYRKGDRCPQKLCRGRLTLKR